ncbi:hypothetical protein [Roseateles amylovorans]|uniref:Uncharacterized protein n=1 Tax=Roseateles amylovorans TaxID=2978473 RepID=A0ABY6B4L1_9BURK|nr:hypothetical protein [Roseateles amylovorans]UXH79222.1 hypothetical protein N4261_04605 [Roseateles amylovorans]
MVSGTATFAERHLQVFRERRRQVPHDEGTGVDRAAALSHGCVLGLNCGRHEADQATTSLSRPLRMFASVRLPHTSIDPPHGHESPTPAVQPVPVDRAHPRAEHALAEQVVRKVCRHFLALPQVPSTLGLALEFADASGVRKVVLRDPAHRHCSGQLRFAPMPTGVGEVGWRVSEARQIGVGSSGHTIVHQADDMTLADALLALLTRAEQGALLATVPAPMNPQGWPMSARDRLQAAWIESSQPAPSARSLTLWRPFSTSPALQEAPGPAGTQDIGLPGADEAQVDARVDGVDGADGADGRAGRSSDPVSPSAQAALMPRPATPPHDARVLGARFRSADQVKFREAAQRMPQLMRTQSCKAALIALGCPTSWVTYFRDEGQLNSKGLSRLDPHELSPVTAQVVQHVLLTGQHLRPDFDDWCRAHHYSLLAMRIRLTPERVKSMIRRALQVPGQAHAPWMPAALAHLSQAGAALPPLDALPKPDQDPPQRVRPTQVGRNASDTAPLRELARILPQAVVRCGSLTAALRSLNQSRGLSRFFNLDGTLNVKGEDRVNEAFRTRITQRIVRDILQSRRYLDPGFSDWCQARRFSLDVMQKYFANGIVKPRAMEILNMTAPPPPPTSEP